MVGARLLLAALVTAATMTAEAQTAGIQIAPVLVSMTPERSISSLRMRNGRALPAAFEIDAYAWSQQNGQDRLTPTRELLVAPGVFEIPANGEQTVRLGVRAPDRSAERAYRIILRELPQVQAQGVALGFTLEMSVPVFVTPRNARPDLIFRIEGERLLLANTGASFTQINLLQGGEPLPAPRYLLAGATAEVALPERGEALRLLTAGVDGGHSERTIDVGRPVHSALVR